MTVEEKLPIGSKITIGDIMKDKNGHLIVESVNWQGEKAVPPLKPYVFEIVKNFDNGNGGK